MPILKFVCAILAGLALAACTKEQAAAPESRPAPKVSVVTVQTRDIPFSLEFVAQTESSRQVDIVARVSGFLDKIAYQEGEMVKQGQLLFQLDPKPFQAQLEAARGGLQAQQARLTTADANLKRVKPLAMENALSQSDLDRAQGDYDAAKAAVYAAQATVTQAELNLGYATIRSPVTGLASRAVQRQGAFLNAASADATLTYVAAIDPIWVNFSVSQNLAAKLRNEIASRANRHAEGLGFRGRDRAQRRQHLPVQGIDQFRRPVVQQRYGFFPGSRGTAQSQARAAPGHVRHRLPEGRHATKCGGRAATRSADGREGALGVRGQRVGRRRTAASGRRRLSG